MRILGILIISAASLMPARAQTSNFEFKLVVGCAPGLVHYPPLFSDKKIICVGPEAIITDANIIFAKPAHDNYSDSLVTITFDKEAQARISEVSGSHVGGQLAVLSQGKLITAAVIMEPILGDTIQLHLAPKDRDAILKQFQDRTIVK
jgi:hypothetical protein